uniref:NADH:ubiquinone reductase (H(+)-translocating) n=1 Tax=Angiostrongylus vasorum TaxID=321387 RepID=J7G046_ANGVA|nr:NADH dehydrogenase subunit 5 [Angiostrongylus vasorum]AFP58671.1 NADH dehydrogenase subunit 5 [Angiostrongylus vasorum]
MVVFLFVLLFFLLFLPGFSLSLSLLEWDFLSLKFSFFYDSLVFSVILLLITLSVVLFSSYYLSGELNFVYYMMMLMLFVGSMFMLNFSVSVFTMMVSWDLLGISSFFLVLFYSNWDSNSGAMNTALTNRLGDYFFFFFFVSSLFSSYYFFSFSFFVVSGLLFLVLASFTKSAQFPFSSWLPKAMSAPTPVSSLVHSSTLVTAGLILLMNFDLMINSFWMMLVMLLVGLFTMFFSSVMALVEEDMKKKVVALSTLSQMGFMMFTLGLGLHFVSLLHLLSHALFKSCLFMQVGYLIHMNFGQQDSRYYGNNGSLVMFIQLQMMTTLFCLCGLVFTSGMVSKDLILEMFFFNSYVMVLGLFFLVSVFLTFGYSYRLWKSLFISFSKVVMSFGGSVLMNYLSLCLVFFSVVFMYWMGENLLCLPSFFCMWIFICLCFMFFCCWGCVICCWNFWLSSWFMSFLLIIWRSFLFMVDWIMSLWIKVWWSLVGLVFFYLISVFSKFFGMMMGSLGYNSLVFLYFFSFLFL